MTGGSWASSQLISKEVGPGEILREYRYSRHLDRFYNLRISIPSLKVDAGGCTECQEHPLDAPATASCA